jgi:AcrR family transcriptional regulator
MEHSVRTESPRTARALSRTPHQLKTEVLEFKRRRVLERARDRLFEQGYKATMLRDLAGDLNVSKAFIYSLYPNKREILAAVCELGLTEALVSLDQALLLELPLQKKLAAVVRSVTATVIEHRKCFVVYQRDVLNLTQPAQRRLHGLRATFDQRVAELVARGYREGALCAGPGELTAATTGALLLWVASWYSPERTITTEAVEYMVGLFSRATGSMSAKP